MEAQTKERIIDWNHVYLLAWYGPDGRPYLTTWSGDLPYITVVVTGPDDAMGTIYQQEEPKDELGFQFLGGKKLWEVCGRGTEYEAELIRLKKED